MRNDVTDDLRGLQDQWRDFSNKTDAQWETAKNRLDQSWEDFTTRYNQRKEQLLNKTQ
jgi:predicted PolB exonuclease-like 3'-5' exonuclease